MSKIQKILLVFIVVLAIFFRFYKISEMPGGLFPDEAANGLDVNLMQKGHLQPFYERGNGREALFFYMLWGSVEIFGKGPWQHHSVSAAVGVFTVLLAFFLTRKIFSLSPEQTEASGQENVNSKAVNIALLAAFLTAVSSWYSVLSRTAFRANLIPLFVSLVLYFLLAAYQESKRGKKFLYSFLTGVSFALGFYTYIAFRIMVPVLGMLIGWPWLAGLMKKQFLRRAREYCTPAIFFAIGFVIFIFPIARYFYTHPGSFIGRSGQVSIFNPTLYTVDGVQYDGRPPIGVVVPVFGEVLKKSLLAYFTSGDLNWRHNISGQPFLSALVSPFFAAGLALATVFAALYFFSPNKRSRWWKYFLLSGWFWGMLLPVVTTAEGIPHGLRSIGTIPVIFIISAWAIYESFGFAMRIHKKIFEKWCGLGSFKYKILRFVLKLTAAFFLLALVLQSYFLYFVYAYNSPENFYSFRSDLTPVSQYLKQRCNKEKTYLILDQFSVQTTDYLTSDRYGNFSSPCNVPYRQVDPENSWQLSGLQSGDQVVFTQSSVFDAKKFKMYHPEAFLIKEVRNRFGQTVLAVYEVKN